MTKVAKEKIALKTAGTPEREIALTKLKADPIAEKRPQLQNYVNEYVLRALS